MTGATSQQVQRVRQDAENGSQRGNGPTRASRKVQDKRPPHRATEASAERCQRCLFHALSSHALGDAVHQALADKPGRLWGHIAGRQPGPARGNDQICGYGMGTHGVCNKSYLVRNDCGSGYREANGAQSLSHRRTG